MWPANEAMRAVLNIIEQRTKDQRRQRGACSSPLAPKRRFASFTPNVHEPLVLRDLPAPAKMPHCGLPATTWSRLSIGPGRVAVIHGVQTDDTRFQLAYTPLQQKIVS